jgi:hypothetical protein
MRALRLAALAQDDKLQEKQVGFEERGWLSLGGQICQTIGMSTATATKVFADRIGRIEVSATMAITAAALKLSPRV